MSAAVTLREVSGLPGREAAAWMSAAEAAAWSGAASEVRHGLRRSSRVRGGPERDADFGRQADRDSDGNRAPQAGAQAAISVAQGTPLCGPSRATCRLLT